MAENGKWNIDVREGFGFGGDFLDFVDDVNQPINITNLSPTMKISGYNRNDEFSVASGNFLVVPPIAPATFPTEWEFRLTAQQVGGLKIGNNEFEVIVTDQNNAIVADGIFGTIKKRK